MLFLPTSMRKTKLHMLSTNPFCIMYNFNPESSELWAGAKTKGIHIHHCPEMPIFLIFNLSHWSFILITINIFPRMFWRAMCWGCIWRSWCWCINSNHNPTIVLIIFLSHGRKPFVLFITNGILLFTTFFLTAKQKVENYNKKYQKETFIYWSVTRVFNLKK